MKQPNLVLKTTPPRLPRTAVVRRALARRREELQDRTAALVRAPRGFGKTTLLSQWRRDWLGEDAFVAWVTLDGQDTPGRFAEALQSALQVASGSSGLASELAQIGPGRETEALTALLAGVAELATLTVLILDDAERLPPETQSKALSYLLYNAPPNLRLVIGARGEVDIDVTELTAKGEIVQIGVEDLRLTLDDTIEVLRRRFGEPITLDDCVHLHEMTEGWPLGLQMAASTIERAPLLSAAVAELNARGGDIERYFLEAMLARLPGALADFLVCCSILESMTPDLCAAVTGEPEASQKLEQLMRETPIVMVGEGEGWMRLHMLARDFLLGRYELLPAEQRSRLHARAAEWYGRHGRLREAAHHALHGGDDQSACRYAALSLREMARQGRLGEAREWIERLTPAAFEQDVYLLLSAAWVHALGDTAGSVYAMVDPVAADAQVEEHARFEAGLIGAAAAIFCDQPGLLLDYVSAWKEVLPATATSFHRLALANSLGTSDLYRGATQQLRTRYERLSREDSSDGSMKLAVAYADVTMALSHLWDGRPALAEELLQPALERAERDSGRRNVIAATLAAVLSAAVFERDQTARARALLANRLDIIDRIGTPDAILVAYRTLADLALADGDERRALDVLGALRDLGERRRIPRMTVVSLAEQVRIHALGSRPETAQALLAQLASAVTAFEQADLSPLQPYCRMKEAIAEAYAAMAGSDEARAGQSLQKAAVAAEAIHPVREALVIRALQGVLLHRRRPAEARAKVKEAYDLASINGLERLVRDVHPLVLNVIGETGGVRVAATVPAAERAAVAVSGGLLTGKETEILRLLTNGLSNKVIARSMDISDETVKWHLKNLFFKLDAGTRKHAVDRARLLGVRSTFVLSSSGHVQSIVNPPGNRKAAYAVHTGEHATPEAFKADAVQHEGSWWPHLSGWLAARSIRDRKAPEKLGSRRYKALAEAPGTYVHRAR